MILALLCVVLGCGVHGAFANIPPELMEMVNNIQATCEAETQIDPALVEAAKRKELQPDPKFKCFLKCMMTHMNCMDDSGTFNGDSVLAVISEDKKTQVVEIFNKCKDTDGSDPCDKAYNLVSCFVKEAELYEMFL